MDSKQEFDLLNGPGAQAEEVPKPFLKDRRQVKAHLKLYLPANVWNSRTVRKAIKRWKDGGLILRCRHPLVRNNEWQWFEIEKLDGPVRRLDQLN